MLLINPAGRMVAVDDENLFKQYLQQPGFTAATPEQEESFKKERQAIIDRMNQKEEEEFVPDVYFATVSQGGKDGYGIASSALVNELTEMGCKLSLYPKDQRVGLLFHNPYSILRMETPFRLIYTMFESDKLPDDWRDYLEVADEILVPSKWCQEVFKKFGFDTTVVPLGYNHKIYQYIERENKRDVRKNFTFLHYNAFNLRKGFKEVFYAFQKAFQKDEPVKLVLKTTLKDPPLPIVPSQYPNIEVETGPYTDEEMVKLMARCDAFVYPSRGEGFGITPLEAMATGMPTIVPNAHGITEYFDSNYMYEVSVKETCPGIYSRYKNQDVGKMVVCDVDHLASQMRYIYEHQDEALDKGRMASEYVKKWTFQRSAARLKLILDSYRDKPAEDRPIKNTLHLEEL